MLNPEERLTHALRLKAALVGTDVPESLHDGLLRYILAGVPTGSFLYAVLANDLADACNRADADNRSRLFSLVLFLVHYAPADCWGTEAKVNAWIRQRGLARQAVDASDPHAAHSGNPSQREK